MDKVFLAYGLPRSPAAPEARGRPATAGVRRARSTPGASQQGDRLRARACEQLRQARRLARPRCGPSRRDTRTRCGPPRPSARCGDDFVLTSSFGKRRSPFTRELDFHPGARPRGAGRHAHPRHGGRRRRLRRPVPDLRAARLVALRQPGHRARRRRLRDPLRPLPTASRCGRARGCSGGTCWPPSATSAGAPARTSTTRSAKRDADGEPRPDRSVDLHSRPPLAERGAAPLRRPATAPTGRGYEPLPTGLGR